MVWQVVVVVQRWRVPVRCDAGHVVAVQLIVGQEAVAVVPRHALAWVLAEHNMD